MTRKTVVIALAVLVLLVLVPDNAWAWSPGTHIFLGQSVLANLQFVPGTLAELLRAHPLDFLYGSIAADTSFAKKYAPVGRHSHAWHVGQEIVELAGRSGLRAFGFGYLAHLAADVVAHNFFVPRQLVLTSSTRALGHSYWEGRFDMHIGEAAARRAREVLAGDHAAPTSTSTGSSRQRSSAWGPTAGCSAGWYNSPTGPTGGAWSSSRPTRAGGTCRSPTSSGTSRRRSTS